MPTWCKNCGALLPDGLERCPKCGKKLGRTPKNSEGISPGEIRLLTKEVLRIVLIPVVIALILGILCYAFLR